MKVLRGSMFVVGTVIGAGFISGAELICFFPERMWELATILSAIAFFLLSLPFCLLGRKYGGFQKTVRALFGRLAPAVFFLCYTSSFICCAVMTAGLDVLFPVFAPLSSILGTVVVLLFLRRGLKGAELLNGILVPVIVFFLLFDRNGLAFSYPSAMSAKGFGGAILYAGLNLFLALPALTEWGAKGGKVSSLFLASVVIAVCAVVILGKIFHEGASAINAEMPLLYVMRESPVFYIISAFAIITSLSSAFYPLLKECRMKTAKKSYAAKGVLLLAAFIVSRIGLQTIVRLAYPVFGIFGIILSVLAVFNEYFFKKGNKKIHCRRQHAKNAGGTHDEVELEYLTAVDDQVTESRL